VSANHVRITLVVDEGPPMLNRGLLVLGLDGLPDDMVREVKLATSRALPPGARFDEDSYNNARTAVARALTNRGYAYAKVTSDARADLASHSVDYTLTVAPGIPAVFGPVTFVGLDPDGAGPAPQEIEEGPLRRTIDIREGTPFSTEKIESATQALLDLEVFSGVHIVPALADPPARVVPLVVQVEPTKLRALRLGGGVEFDAIKTEAHALVGWEDHNLLGGLRDLRIDLTPGLVFYPTSTETLQLPTRYFPQERLKVVFRWPAFPEARTTSFLQPEFNVFPLLVKRQPTDADQVPGYIEPKAAIGAERRFGPLLLLRASYNVQGEVPFGYYVPPGGVLPGSAIGDLPAVILSFPQLVAQFKAVDNPTDPHAGFVANFDLQAALGQAALGPFGGTAADVRIQPDVQGYIPITRDVTFALNLGLGLLFPFNYGSSIEGLGPGSQASCSPLLPPGQPCVANTDVQTMYFRGYFSGGPSDNRGYSLRGVAPYGVVGFLNPATAAKQVAGGFATICNPINPADATHPAPYANPAYDYRRCLSPIGGFTMWQVSAEVRFAVARPVFGAVFCDAGDVSQTVFPRPRSLRFDYLHMSCGIGGRYDTPVGPIRLDIGYRLPSLQVLGHASESDAQWADPTLGSPPLPGGPVLDANRNPVLGTNGQPLVRPAFPGSLPRIFGQPFAIAFGIGESF
jgi:outer membrane protein insertion porin family/translocation and assembly module TamA